VGGCNQDDTAMISILIPTFNGAKWAKRSLDSIVAQGQSVDYEVIIVDNCSEDGIEDIVKGYSFKLKNLQFYTEKEEVQVGGCGTMNAFNHATGDIIMQLSVDDELLPGALVHIQEAFNNPEVQWIYSLMDLVDDKDGHVIASMGWDPIMTFEKELTTQVGSYSSCAFRKSVIDEYGFLDYKNYSVCDDYEFMLRLLYNGVEPHYIPEKLVQYHYTGENYSVVHRAPSGEGDGMLAYYRSLPYPKP
jgi:glycosyltransferase involved in cell wall biosynthesis